MPLSVIASGRKARGDPEKGWIASHTLAMTKDKKKARPTGRAFRELLRGNRKLRVCKTRSK